MADVPREREHGLPEHDVRDGDTDQGADYLHDDVAASIAPRHSALRGVRQGHGRVEVGAGDRAECQDERDEGRSGRHGVCQ